MLSDKVSLVAVLKKRGDFLNYGIVAEFNPFHNGHKFLIDSVKDENNTVTVVMSESFVQRGECACIDISSRVKMALLNGADLVLSLPAPYATASAEKFALGGISVLNGLGCVDSLAFGSECGDAEILKKCAEIITSDKFLPALENRLSEGLSYPDARQKALADLCGEDFAKILSSPNDILGVEYIKAINRLNSKMTVSPLKRQGVSHDSEIFNGSFSSASAIRKMMLSGEAFEDFIPENVFQIIKEDIKNGKAPADFKNLEKAALYKMRTMTEDDFRQLPDVSEGLEYRIVQAVKTITSLDGLLEKSKTKRYTHSRLRRIILCAFLGIKKEDVDLSVPYVRVLGFNEKGAKLLKEAKEKATLPIVTKSSDFKALSDEANRVFRLECLARDIFSLALPQVEVCSKEMTDKMIVHNDTE